MPWENLGNHQQNLGPACDGYKIKLQIHTSFSYSTLMKRRKAAISCDLACIRPEAELKQVFETMHPNKLLEALIIFWRELTVLGIKAHDRNACENQYRVPPFFDWAVFVERKLHGHGPPAHGTPPEPHIQC